MRIGARGKRDHAIGQCCCGLRRGMRNLLADGPGLHGFSPASDLVTSSWRPSLLGIALHNVRRTCAGQMYYAAFSETEQIPCLLGHENVKETNRYIAGSTSSEMALNDGAG